MTSAELDAALDEAFGPVPENPYLEAALAKEAEFFAENLVAVLKVSIEAARGMVEIVDGKVVMKQAELGEAIQAAGPERVQRRQVAFVRKHRQESAYQYALIQRRTNPSGSALGFVRQRTSRPRERRAVHGRRRRTSTTRDDGPAEPVGHRRGVR